MYNNIYSPLLNSTSNYGYDYFPNNLGYMDSGMFNINNQNLFSQSLFDNSFDASYSGDYFLNKLGYNYTKPLMYDGFTMPEEWKIPAVLNTTYGTNTPFVIPEWANLFNYKQPQQTLGTQTSSVPQKFQMRANPDSDTSYFNYNIKLTPQLSSRRNVNQRFLDEVVAMSKRLNCDPADLLAIMDFESGINPASHNPNSTATGLIQFVQSTAEDLGTSTSALSKMSATEQLKYVEKYLMQKKESSGIGIDTPIDGATLYSLVFLPGRANRETLTERGEDYYTYNTVLDCNGKGTITKEDLYKVVQRHRARLGYSTVGEYRNA